MAGMPPPPPPPPVNIRGPPPPHPSELPRGPGGPGPGPGPGMPMPMPPMQPMQPMPMRNSTRFRDVSRRSGPDEEGCRKKLTTYKAFTMQKAGLDSKIKPTSWAQANCTEEAWSQDEIKKQIKRLDEKRDSVADTKQRLAPNQQKQVNGLLDELIHEDRDPNFEWSLAQIDQKIRPLKTGQRETTTLTVYAKRSPSRDVNVIDLFNVIQARNKEIFARMTRPPAPLPGKGDKAPEVIKIDKKGGDKKGDKKIKGSFSKKKKYYGSGSESGSFSDSDSGSSSDYSSTDASSWSSRSGRRQKKHGGRYRSHSRLRYINGPPDPRIRDSFGPVSPVSPVGLGGDTYGGGPRPRYVPPEVPYVVTPAAVAVDVDAAYMRGKMDADAERFEAERRALESRAIVIARPERYEGRPRLVREARYVDDLRYDDELRRDELRRDDLRREELRRRELELNDYVDYRRASVVSPRIVYANPNPFDERRRSPPRRYSYTPSLDSYDW